VRRRLATRLKGFVSTFRRRVLWSSSSSRCSRNVNEAIATGFTRLGEEERVDRLMVQKLSSEASREWKRPLAYRPVQMRGLGLDFTFVLSLLNSFTFNSLSPIQRYRYIYKFCFYNDQTSYKIFVSRLPSIPAITHTSPERRLSAAQPVPSISNLRTATKTY